MPTISGKNSTGAVQQQVTLTPLNLLTAEVRIVGLTELIVHRWSDKARRMMLEKQTQATSTSKPRAKREPKDPEDDFQQSIYRLDDGRDGFPAAGFKGAMVGACRLFDGLTMTQAKLLFHVIGEGADSLVPIEGEAHRREDMVRLETGVADIRYRAGYFPWAAVLRIRYNAGVLRLDDIVALVDGAGQGGVGEWRPSAPKSTTGNNGMFQVVTG